MKQTLEQVIAELNKARYNFIKIKRNLYEDINKVRGGYGPFLYTSREIFKLHKWTFRKVGNHETKKFTKGKDRSAARDKIKTEKFDDIPSNKRVKESDPWSWD